MQPQSPVRPRSNLRAVTMGVLLLAFVSLALGQWISARWLYDGGFEAAERRDALARARHARSIFLDLRDLLERYAADNAQWDEAYAFMQGRAPRMPEIIFSPDSYKLLWLSGFAFVGVDGRLVDVRQYDRTRKQFITVREEFERALAPDGVLGRQYRTAGPSGGYVRIGADIYTWGAAPIVHSDGHGPAAGFLVVISRLDQDLLDFASHALDSRVELERVPDGGAGAYADGAELQPGDVRFSVPDDSRLETRFPLGTLGDHLALGVKLTTPRVVHATALRSTQYFLWTTLIFGTLLTVLALRFIERRLLKPLQTASQALVRIGKRGDLSERIEAAPRNDEIGALVDAANEMLAQLKGKRDAEAARDAAVAANRVKSEFLARMSHEIRTPINGVLGMNELLLASELQPHQRRWAQAARASGTHLLEVVNDVLDFSKIEAGQMRMESVDFDVVWLVEDALAMFARPSQDKGLELVAQLTGLDGAPSLRGDPLRLRQVLINLIDNAIKFTDHGEIVVRAALSEPAGGAALLRLCVEDTGIGIAPEAQARIFEHFTQADGSMTRRFGGTGLGLAITQRLLALMGGTIRVESAPGEGSRFILELRLPLAPAPTATGATRFLEGVPVLVVDDNRVGREILRQQLHSWGMQVACAAAAEEALRLMSEAESAGVGFRLAVLDTRMPGMDGLQAAREIRARPALAATPLIMLTSIEDDAERLAQLQPGILRCVGKPVRRAELLEALAGILAGDSSAPAAALPEPVVAAPATGSVLLVEDNVVNQEVAEAMLSSLGWHVTAATNGAEALEAVRLRHFDVVLMDCQMPVMDGFEATAAIRRLPGHRGRQAIVALTANAMQGEEQRCLAAGMDGFLSKPYSIGELKETLARWAPADPS